MTKNSSNDQSSTVDRPRGARIRRVLRRVDDYTLVVFNPRYPTPSRER